MNPSEFDKFADEYAAVHAANVRLSGESPDYFAAYKVAEVHAAFEGVVDEFRTILDFGAGVGSLSGYHSMFILPPLYWAYFARSFGSTCRFS